MLCAAPDARQHALFPGIRPDVRPPPVLTVASSTMPRRESIIARDEGGCQATELLYCTRSGRGVVGPFAPGYLKNVSSVGSRLYFAPGATPWRGGKSGVFGVRERMLGQQLRVRA